MSSSAIPILKSGFRKRGARARLAAAVGRARVALDLGSMFCALRRQAAVAAVAAVEVVEVVEVVKVVKVVAMSSTAAPPSEQTVSRSGLSCSVDILSMFFGTECPLGARLKPAFCDDIGCARTHARG